MLLNKIVLKGKMKLKGMAGAGGSASSDTADTSDDTGDTGEHYEPPPPVLSPRKESKAERKAREDARYNELVGALFSIIHLKGGLSLVGWMAVG